MNRQVLVTGLLRLTALLPLPLAHAVGACCGWLLWWMPNSARRIAARNLALCYPELPVAGRERLLRRNLLETGKLLLELGPLWLWPGERPHLGAWEMAGLYYSSRHPLTILYRPSRLGLDELSRQGRGRLGGKVVATDASGVRALLTALRNGEILGILPDQDPGGEGGVFAPLFGIAASTMTLVSRLALKTGAPVFLTWAERLPRGRGFALHLRALPEVTAAVSLDESAAALNRGVEAAIRSLPAQYLWVYKRFKTRPPGQPKLY